MSDTSRSVMALAALGAGLVHLAVAAGAPLVGTLALGALGVAELAWALAVLSRGRVLAPRTALLGSLAPVGLWGLLMTIRVVGGQASIAEALPLGPVAAASALNLTVAVFLAVYQRAQGGGRRTIRPTRPGRYLVGMLVGAMAVAGIVTPALAATSAGSSAVPHGEHGTTHVDDSSVPGSGTHLGH